MEYLKIHSNIYTEILKGIMSESAKSIPQCYYIVGYRGYGKTGLLRNLEKTLKKADKFCPLYVDCPISPSFMIFETILKYNKTQGRLILLLDDADILFKDMGRDDLFRLRSILYKEGAPIIVGTGVELSSLFTDYQAPFYDAFILYRLKELTDEVSISLFENMRNRSHTARNNITHNLVLELLDEMGKTPESCRLLSNVSSFDVARPIILMEALEPLSLYYREKLISLSPLQRKTLIYMLTKNNPVLLKDIREATGQSAGDISPQLKALSIKGLVTTNRQNIKKTEYSVADKVMRSWFKNCVMKESLQITHLLNKNELK